MTALTEEDGNLLKKGDALTLDEEDFWVIVEDPQVFTDTEGEYLTLRVRKCNWKESNH